MMESSNQNFELKLKIKNQISKCELINEIEDWILKIEIENRNWKSRIKIENVSKNQNWKLKIKIEN